MKIYLDTADVHELVDLTEWGAFAGVTTNPVLLSKAGLETKEAIKRLSSLFNGDFFVQTWGETAGEMLEHTKYIYSRLGARTVVKIPITEEGLKVIHRLSRKEIRTSATALFTASQAMLATEAGVNILIPFYSRIEASGKDPRKVIELIKHVQKAGKPEILVASLKTVEQVLETLSLDVDAITVPPKLARELMISEETKNTLKDFQEASSGW